MNSSDLKPRAHHVSAFLAHCIVFFSGAGADGNLHSLRSLCLYNPYTDRCLQFEITGEMEVPTTRFYACAVNIGEDIVMFGGTGTSNKADLNDVWKLTFDERHEKLHNLRWQEIKVEPASATPSPRFAHSGWAYKDLLWTFGGWGPTPQGLSQQCLHAYGEFRNDDKGDNNQLLSFNPSIPQWINHESRGATPCPRMNAAAAVLGGTVWLYGGEKMIPPLDDLYQLDMDNFTWTQVQMIGTEPPCFGFNTLSPLSEQSLLLCGGPEVFMLKVLAPYTVELSKLTIRPNRCHRMGYTATTITGGNVVTYGGDADGNCSPTHIATNDLLVLFSNHMTLFQLATRTFYKHLDTFALRDIPFTIRKLIFFPVTVQGKFQM